jgi:hypothetical protein
VGHTHMETVIGLLDFIGILAIFALMVEYAAWRVGGHIREAQRPPAAPLMPSLLAAIRRRIAGRPKIASAPPNERLSTTDHEGRRETIH